VEVRDARKDLVRRIEKVLDELEAHKLGAWREQNKAEGTAEIPVVEQKKEEVIPVVVEDADSSNVADDSGRSPVEKDVIDSTESTTLSESEALQDDAESTVQTSEKTNLLGEEEDIVEEAKRADSPTSSDDDEVEDPGFPSYPPVSTIAAAVESPSSAVSSPVILPSDFDPSDLENEQGDVKEKTVDRY